MNDDLLIVNKPKGMVVHPAASTITVHCNALPHTAVIVFQGLMRVKTGIVHRIDKDTSGLLM